MERAEVRKNDCGNCLWPRNGPKFKEVVIFKTQDGGMIMPVPHLTRKLKACMCSMSPEKLWISPVTAPSPENHGCSNQWEFLIWLSLTLSCLDSKVGLFIYISGSLCTDSLFETIFSIYWQKINFLFISTLSSPMYLFITAPGKRS